MAKLYTRSRSPKWWAYYPNPSGGTPIRRSTGISATEELRNLAQLRANEMELEDWKRWKPGGAVEEYTFEQLMVQFIDDTQPGRGHMENIRVLRKYFANMKLSEFSGKAGVGVIGGYKLFRKGRASGTVRRELSVLSSALNHVIREYGWEVENPVIGRLPPKSKPRLRWLRPEEARSLHKAANADLKDFIVLGLSTGMRRSELTSMTKRRCDLKFGVFHFDPEDQKAKRHDTLPMSQTAREIIKRRLAKKADQENPRLFDWDNPRKAYSNAVTRAKLDGVIIHTLRHTFASWMVQAGVPLREVQELMRHESVTTTEKYAHLAPRTETHYLHTAVIRPGQGLEVIDEILRKQGLT